MHFNLGKFLCSAALAMPAAILFAAAAPPSAGDWPDWRGPNRDGVSHEKNLPEKWSPAGQNLAWKAPYGGRSTPVVLGDRLYLQNSAGKGETQQERVMCFNADTGKLLWEYRFNVFQSDVPAHRVGWASPAADAETGNVYAFGVNGTLLGLSKEGKLLWERSLGEEFDLFTTHGGRTVSPVVDGNLVIVKAASSTWGTQANRSIRFMAFDKRSGEMVWVSTPGGRPFDTDYSQPVIARINGTRLLIAGLGDGGVHAIKIATGEPVWHFLMSKRAINTAPVLNGTTVIVSHGQENLEGNEMGMLAAIDATAKGNIAINQAKWANKGFIGEFSSGIVDGDRYLQVDNGANLYAFDVRHRPPALEADSRHRAEIFSRLGRWQNLRGHGEREILYPAAARGPLRGAERRGIAHQPAGAVQRKSAGAGSCFGCHFARPRLFRLERHAVRHRKKDAGACAAGHRRRAASSARPGHMGSGGSHGTDFDSRSNRKFPRSSF